MPVRDYVEEQQVNLAVLRSLRLAKPLTLDAYETPTLAELAPVIEGKPDVTRLSAISLRELGERFRTQKIVFSAASDIYEQMKTTWKGNHEYLLAQVIRLAEKYIESDKLRIEPTLFNQDPLRRRIIITLHMTEQKKTEQLAQKMIDLSQQLSQLGGSQ